MFLYYPVIEIALMCVGILLWAFCYHFVRKRREAERLSTMPANSPSVYVIPIYEEEQVGEEDEEMMDVYEAYFQPPYREPPMYCSRNVSPPPYRFEPPSYPDPPPSYSDLQPYSERP